MAGAADGVHPADSFPLNLPLRIDYSFFGVNLADCFGRSISGVGGYLALFDKVYPHFQAALLSCIGDGMGKRSVTLIATIVLTVLALPFFCALGLFYNVVVGGTKGVYGVLNYLAHKKAEEGGGDKVEPQYVRLFQEVTQHLCFAGLDLAGEFTALTFLFAGAFAFDGKSVKGRFHEMEAAILDGSAYGKIEGWGQELGWVKVDSMEGADGGGGSAHAS